MSGNLNRLFGNRLRVIRKHRKLSHATLAEKAGLSVQMISRLETAKSGARFETIEKLAGALDVEFADLFASVMPRKFVPNPKVAPLISKMELMSDDDLDLVSQMIKRLPKA